MDAKAFSQFAVLTIGLFIGLGAIIGAAYRGQIATKWEENRCDPYVIPIAGFFKPSNDQRTPSQFARDNWSFCQKEYIQTALRTAATPAKELAEVQAGTVGLTQDIAGVVADVFNGVWRFCYEAYSSFMDRMKGAARLFQNFMVNLHSIVDRLQAAVLSIVFGLMSLITAYVDAVQLVLIVAIVIIGILLSLMIILFFVLLPISGLIVTMSALVASTVVAVGTAIAAATVSEMFAPGACFAKGTRVILQAHTKAIEEIRIGDVLSDGGRVTAVHKFRSNDTIYDLRGVLVTGDHLVQHPTMPERLIAVRDHPDATATAASWLGTSRDVWCLTTSTRRIPCLGHYGIRLLFADWEEIEEGDMGSLEEWHNQVWLTLNGRVRQMSRVSESVLKADAGLAPDCAVACKGWLGQRVWKPVSEVQIGDVVFDAEGRTTVVVGVVEMEGDLTTDVVELPGGAHVSCATWIQHAGVTWTPAIRGLPVVDVHPVRWHHLYTASGTFMIGGDWLVRDASEVGLGALRTLVEDVVLG
jgi:hypothetical protein